MSSVLQHTEHRPWALPKRPWGMFMRWSDLAFLHWPVPADLLRSVIPHPLVLDTFDGTAWIGVVPFRMEHTRLRWAPRIPTATTFPEVNVRTYVRGADRAGVWFLSLDAASRLVVWAARRMFNLPYFRASMRMEVTPSAVQYSSERAGRSVEAVLRVKYSATGEVFQAAAGTLDHWLTERYCLFGQHRSGSLFYMDVHHLPWPLQKGRAEAERNSLSEASGVRLPSDAPLVHVSKALDVWAWSPVRIRS
jgi:uncharacterized protein